MNKTHIYVILNNVDPTGIYVGITIEPLKRWHRHKSDAKNNVKNKCQRLCNAINKYGDSNFTYKIIDEFSSRQEANEAEVFMIKMYRDLGLNVYNIQAGGSLGNLGLKFTRSEDQKRAQCKFSLEKENEICKEYIDNKIPANTLAKIFGCARYTIQSILKRNEVKMRTQKECQILCARRGKDNHNYGKGMDPVQLEKMLKGVRGKAAHNRGKKFTLEESKKHSNNVRSLTNEELIEIRSSVINFKSKHQAFKFYSKKFNVCVSTIRLRYLEDYLADKKEVL